MAKKEDFSKIIANMDPEEHERTTAKAENKNPNNTRILNTKRRARGFGSILKRLGIGERWYSGSSTGESSQSYRGSSTSREFRDGYRVPTPPTSRGFSPYDINEVDIANARDYYKGADGKGDSDCGHEH